MAESIKLITSKGRLGRLRRPCFERYAEEYFQVEVKNETL